MINILFGGNYKVYDGILLCLLSMTKHCSEELNIFVLTADVTELNKDYKPLTDNQISILDDVLKNKNPNSKVQLIQLGSEFNDWILNSSNKSNKYTPFAFLRLFADKIKNLPDKIIYLDTDIMLNGNINDLFSFNIDDVEVGVVKDRYGHYFIKPNYFNSGMLLMNMKAIKESKLLDNVRDYCFKKKLGFPDQSALNKYCTKKLYLPRKFNEQGKLKDNTIVHHFTKKIKWLPIFHTINIKPWHIANTRTKYKCYAYDETYAKYQQIKNSMKF